MADTDKTIKELPLTTKASDDDDIIIEDSSPTTYRIKASDLKSYITEEVQEQVTDALASIQSNTNLITQLNTATTQNTSDISALNTALTDVKNGLFEVQYGRTEAFSVAAGAITEYDVTFPTAFSKTPQVFITCYSATTASTFGSNSWMVYSISTTGFTIRVANDESAGRSPSFNWLAIAG